MTVDPIELAYDLFHRAACEAMVASPGDDQGVESFRLTLITIASMCVSGAASLSTDVAAARSAIMVMVGNAPPVNVLEVIADGPVGR
jgi:hypothetical protein